MHVIASMLRLSEEVSGGAKISCDSEPPGNRQIPRLTRVQTLFFSSQHDLRPISPNFSGQPTGISNSRLNGLTSHGANAVCVHGVAPDRISIPVGTCISPHNSAGLRRERKL